MTRATTFDPGFAITPTREPMGFAFGPDAFGPREIEYRRLDAIRSSLDDPLCTGPDPVYAIAMDTGKRTHRLLLKERNLLFGVVTYAAGRLGREPVRSQGHVHRIVRGHRMSPPEVYEIWTGRAIIYMQEHGSGRDPGRCYAVHARAGDVVVVPPDWAHATISADPDEALTFGAWCDRQYGFEYDEVRAHHGLAWRAFLDEAQTGEILWSPNPSYEVAGLIEKEPASHASTLGIEPGVPIYTQFERDPDVFLFVPEPQMKSGVWKHFIP
jgi:glucose-6-phosphate isomerase, archaeal